MERSLFAFIWKYSWQRQLVLLGVTLLSFPLLYISLELPKRIINDAIGAQSDVITVWGYDLTQVEYLLMLCVMFLLAVLASGLMKMRINTMKGILSERMLRRFRYQLLGRMLRFPQPYFRTTSQGELVSMITSEAEPMGGLMGDAVAQPVFQFGQMMTIVAFLFMQSVWFGLASIALIPLQAWLIPMLQRQINLLNKDRIHEIRGLASEIGESAAGIGDLRANGGIRYRLSLFTYRLGTLFNIRFKIYQKKFFMKFLNNFITQLTPFFFYSVGGYLAIKGEITVGALVAALGAYKDIASPWKELLSYYNQVQDMSLRWQIVTEKFQPKGMIAEHLVIDEPVEIPRLNGAIEIRDVTVRDQNGNAVLEDINLDIPAGARVAIQSRNEIERSAMADLLTRELMPSRGSVSLAGHRLDSLHQAVISARVGYAHSDPYLFEGSLGDNLLMPLKTRPQVLPWAQGKKNKRLIESERSGNSGDILHADWVDPSVAGLGDSEDIRNWWFQLTQAMGTDEIVFRRTLRSRFDPHAHPVLARKLVELRDEVHERLKEKGLDEFVHRFDPSQFNPSIPLGGNILFATPSRDISQEDMASDGKFMRILSDLGLAEDALAMSLGIIDILRQTFGRDGTDHPMFRRLGMDEAIYLKLSDIAERRKQMAQDDAPSQDECNMLLTVPFLLTAEQIGPSFPDSFKEKIVEIRKSRFKDLRREVGDTFAPVEPDLYLPRLTVLENALYGRISMMAGVKAEEIENEVAEILDQHDLRRRVASIFYDIPAGLGGSNLPTIIQERAAFSRAGIKRPDILIFDKALESHDAKSRADTRQRLRELLPEATIIFMEDKFEHPEAYDLFIKIENGRIDGDGLRAFEQMDPRRADELRQKMRAIAANELFSGLSLKNQRLMAFGAQWFEVKAGQAVFSEGEKADAAYLCISGESHLLWPKSAETDTPLTVVEPGRLIGDLSVILGEERKVSLVAQTDSRFLRIGAREFRDVMESDASVAVSLLETVSGHLSDLATRLQTAGIGPEDFADEDADTQFARDPRHADA